MKRFLKLIAAARARVPARNGRAVHQMPGDREERKIELAIVRLLFFLIRALIESSLM
jgi:hypothetical protein